MEAPNVRTRTRTTHGGAGRYDAADIRHSTREENIGSAVKVMAITPCTQSEEHMLRGAYSRSASRRHRTLHQQHVLASSLAALFLPMSGRKVFASDLGGGGWDISSCISTDAWYHVSSYQRIQANDRGARTQSSRARHPGRRRYAEVFPRAFSQHKTTFCSSAAPATQGNR